MATINDIIITEFQNYGYEIITKMRSIVIFKHKEFEDFWVVCVEGFELNMQRDLYEATIKNITTDYPYAAKNSSLLVLIDLDRKQLTTDQTVEIEKDPYFFKKYVLPYSEGLTRHLLELMECKGATSISDLIMQPESFNTLNEENSYGMYHLLYAIAHKLPFIPIKAEQKGIQPRDFLFDTPQEWQALEEVMAIDGDVQAMYDNLKTIVEKEANEQH